MSDLYFTVQIELNVCQNVYGQLPCTAALGPGFECTNSFATCQDTANYAPGSQFITLKPDSMAQALSAGDPYNSYPLLTAAPKFTSTEIKRGEGVAVRGGVDIICTDAAIPETHGAGVMDPYASTRGSTNAGTFWGKFKARFPYYARSKVIVNFWDLRDPSALSGADLIESMEYRFETIQGPDPSGKVILKCRDLLTNIDTRDSQLPEVDNARLADAINPTITTITIIGQNNAIWPPANGSFFIEDEWCTYGNYNGAGTFSNVTRGAGGTTNVAHDLGEAVIYSVHWENINVVDLLYDILTTYADIDPSYIPYNNDPGNPDEWDNEKASFLSGYNITKAIFEPQGAVQALNELCKQTHVNLWYDPKLKKIRISATNTVFASQQAQPITDTANILTPGVKVIEREKRMISQGWFYYDKKTVGSGNEPLDYSEVDVAVNTVLESPNAWGHKRIEVNFGTWLFGADNVAIATNSRILTERSRPQYEITFLVDYKDSDAVRPGTFINLKTDAIQGYTGQAEELTWQIIKATDKAPGATVEVTAASIRPVSETQGVRQGFITNVANENTEYGDASPADQGLWAWIAATDGLSDGSDPYTMQ